MRVSCERTLVTISGRNKKLQREGETGPSLCGEKKDHTKRSAAGIGVIPVIRTQRMNVEKITAMEEIRSGDNWGGSMGSTISDNVFTISG